MNDYPTTLPAVLRYLDFTPDETREALERLRELYARGYVKSEGRMQAGKEKKGSG